MQQKLAIQGLRLNTFGLLIECDALSYAVLRCWHLGLAVGASVVFTRHLAKIAYT